MDKYRKLLVMALNELLHRDVISLEQPGPDGHIEARLANETCMIIWREIGCEEAQVSVWWKYDHVQHPQAELSGNQRESFRSSLPLAPKSKFPLFIGAAVSGWLERRTGKYLQGKGRDYLFDVYTRAGEAEILEALPEPVAQCFRAEGRKFF